MLENKRVKSRSLEIILKLIVYSMYERKYQISQSSICRLFWCSHFDYKIIWNEKCKIKHFFCDTQVGILEKLFQEQST